MFNAGIGDVVALLAAIAVGSWIGMRLRARR
jgi:hypothetical protein